MKIFLRLSLLLTVLCLLSVPALAQRKGKTNATKPTATAGESVPVVRKSATDRAICKSEKVPAGYKIVGETADTICPDGAWVIRTRAEQANINLATQQSLPPVRRRNVRNDDDDEAEPAPTKTTTSAPSGQRKLSNREAEDAIRARRVIIGMTKQDVNKAWGSRHQSATLIDEIGSIDIWTYSRAKVYFRDGLVCEVIIIR